MPSQESGSEFGRGLKEDGQHWGEKGAFGIICDCTIWGEGGGEMKWLQVLLLPVGKWGSSPAVSGQSSPRN